LNPRYTERFVLHVGRLCREITVATVAQKERLHHDTVRELDRLYIAGVVAEPELRLSEETVRRGVPPVTADSAVAVRLGAAAGRGSLEAHRGDDLSAPELRYLVPGHTALVQEDREEPCAWYQDPGVAFLTQFAIHPTWQGRGLSRMLLHHVEERAREQGMKELALDKASGALRIDERENRNNTADSQRIESPGSASEKCAEQLAYDFVKKGKWLKFTQENDGYHKIVSLKLEPSSRPCLEFHSRSTSGNSSPGWKNQNYRLSLHHTKRTNQARTTPSFRKPCRA